MLDILDALIFKSTGGFSKRNPITYLILILSLLFGVYLIGEVTTSLQDVKNKVFSNKIDKDTIVGKLILTPKGYSNSNHWIKYGATIEVDKSNDILSNYENNSNKYFGFFDDLEILKSFQKVNNKLIISEENFGYDEIAWAVRDDEKLRKVLYNINNEIIKLQDDDTIMDLCKDYFFNESYLCRL